MLGFRRVLSTVLTAGPGVPPLVVVTELRQTLTDRPQRPGWLIWLIGGLGLMLAISMLPLDWGVAHGQTVPASTGTGTGGGPVPTTPQDIRVSNLGYNGFTVSWTTTDPVAGYVCFWKPGDGPSVARLAAADARGNGAVRAHYVDVPPGDRDFFGLDPDTLYVFDLMSGSPSDTATPCAGSQERARVRTAVASGPPSPQSSAYGVVRQPGSTPAGAIVYLSMRSSAGQSTLLSVQVGLPDGNWTIPLANARINTSTGDLVAAGDYWPVASSDRVDVEAWASPEVTDRARRVPVDLASPFRVPDLNLGVRSIWLSAGFNVISFNVNPPDGGQIESVLGGIGEQVGGVNTFEALPVAGRPQGARSFYPSLAAISDLQRLDGFHGYVVEVVTNTVLYVEGAPVDGNTIALAPGWNLVSFLPNEPMTLNLALRSVLGDVVWVEGREFMGYDPASDPQLGNQLVLRPGRGYWIKLRESLAGPRTLVYPWKAP